MSKFRNLYKNWSEAQYGLLITGQVQVDIRYFSIAGDVCCHSGSTEEPAFSMWKEWAQVAQKNGTPCIVQLAHPGRMSPPGAGNRPTDMAPLCPSSVPVKSAPGRVLETPKAMTLEDIDVAVANWVRGAVVARDAGFAGIQLHGAHGFLLSQFLSPHTNRRTDEYGGTPQKRLKFLQRLVTEIRAVCPPSFCLSVKLNSGDYMAEGGLSQDEALDQVRWLLECGMVDFVEISGGNAEQSTSKLHNSFGNKSLSAAPKKQSTRIREAYFTDFAEKIAALKSEVPIQLSGGFRSRVGMADAIDSGACQLIGLGRAAVLEPSLPRETLLNPSIPDDQSLALPHAVRGLWFANLMPAGVVGSGPALEYFYWNMRRLGSGLKSDPYASVPYVICLKILGHIHQLAAGMMEGATAWLRMGSRSALKRD
ncbi:MAG: hypothetical protein M1822_000333 [Bathelium mastoideum]|nr:MAG: hypothetical protein M1822_000333 [Bathelium mastoideum]